MILGNGFQVTPDKFSSFSLFFCFAFLLFRANFNAHINLNDLNQMSCENTAKSIRIHSVYRKKHQTTALLKLIFVSLIFS